MDDLKLEDFNSEEQEEPEEEGKKKNKKKNKKPETPGKKRFKKIFFILIWVLLAAELALGVTFIVKLGTMHVFPTKYYVIGIVVYVIINALLVLWNVFKKLPVLEAILILAMVLGLIYANLTIFKLDGVLSKLNNNSKTEVSQFSLVVLADDPAQEIADLEGYTVGYATSAAYIDDAVAALDQMTKVNYQTVDDQITLAEDLMSQKVQCIMIATEYLDLISDIDELDLFSEDTRVVGTIDTEHTVEQDTDKTDENKTQYVIYISGIDTYGKINTVSRSDVNILAFINTETGRCQLISTPRDSYVQCPHNNYAYDKLTNCGIYGIDSSEETLEYLYGGDFEIDYYMRVNFSGFINIIDELGGVDVTNEREFTSVDGYHYEKGDLHLDGTEALNFARERKAFAAGVIARDTHQMDVIKAVINKMTSSTEMLSNFGNILDAVSDSFQTDMPTSVMYDFVNMQLNNGTSWKVTSFSMNGEGARSKECYSQPGRSTYVMHLDEDMIAYGKELIKANKEGYEIDEYKGKEY